MTEPDALAQIQHQLQRLAGGYLRNPSLRASCGRCFTPLPTGGLCDKCTAQVRMPDLPDALGFMSYATHDDPAAQSGRVMRGYKWPTPLASATRTVQMLAAVGLRRHTSCLSRLVGVPVTRWATVPSLPPKDGQHPLNTLVAALATTRSEIRLQGTSEPCDPRALDVTHFQVLDSVPQGVHVLLIDDTWTGGGHSQSAALALRAAGASKVSLLVLARWLTLGFGFTTSTWLKTHLASDYNPTVCPYTQGACPT